MKKILRLFVLASLILCTNSKAEHPLAKFVRQTEAVFFQNREHIGNTNRIHLSRFMEHNQHFIKNLKSGNALIVLDSTDRILSFLKYYLGDYLTYVFIARVYLKHNININEDLVKLTAKSGFTDIMRMFLTWGLNPNTYIFGSTLLHYAADYDRDEMVKLLLQAGACPFLLNVYDKTPLQIAQLNKNKTIEDILTKAQASPSSQLQKTGHFDDYTVNFVIRFGIMPLLHLFFRWGLDPNRIIAGSPLLHRAVFFNKPKIVEFLLKKGAERKARNVEDQTALEIAVNKGLFDIAKIINSQ